MTITREQLDAAVWGTGYGSKKHLVDHEISRLRVPTPWGYSNSIRARCVQTVHIDAALDTNDPRGLLSRRTECSRCRRIADAEVVR